MTNDSNNNNKSNNEVTNGILTNDTNPQQQQSYKKIAREMSDEDSRRQILNDELLNQNSNFSEISDKSITKESQVRYDVNKENSNEMSSD